MALLRGPVRLIAVAAAAGAGMGIVLFAIQDRFIYHPRRAIEATPGHFRVPYEEVRLLASDGETIMGWFVPAEIPVATILFLHGNAGNIGDRVRLLLDLRAAGFSVLMIDYRGYGQSGGRPSEQGIVRDARAAWDYLTRERGVPAGRVILYGESLGAAPALQVARQVRREGGSPPGAMVLVGAFTSLVDMGRAHFPFLPVRLLLRSSMDNMETIREVDAPTLLIHAALDEVAPVEMGRRLHEASTSRIKELYEVPGASHNTLWLVAAPDLCERIRAFVERALAEC